MSKNLQKYLVLRKKENKLSKNIRDFLGEGVQIQENPKSLEKKEEVFFCRLMDSLISLDERTITFLEGGIDLTIYDDLYHQIIEEFTYKYYGKAKTQVIMWWLISIQEIEKKSNLSLKIEENGREYIVNTPKQLYKVLSKMKA
jgi:5-bromo-4-chloroindolyl phosphate hydrolysis protein